MFSLAMIPVAFVCGSLPFSVWLTKLFINQDVRQYGNGNPGAANAFRAGSFPVGLLTLLLDISKAAIPVGLAYNNLHIRGATMFLIAVAPILGHIFSPFLSFRGGKAIAASFGVWIGLTLWKASLPGVITVTIGIILFTTAGWAVMLALCAILITLLVWLPDPLLILVWIAETLLLAWTHRSDLREAPYLRPWLAKHLSKRKA